MGTIVVDRHHDGPSAEFGENSRSVISIDRGQLSEEIEGSFKLVRIGSCKRFSRQEVRLNRCICQPKRGGFRKGGSSILIASNNLGNGW